VVPARVSKVLVVGVIEDHAVVLVAEDLEEEEVDEEEVGARTRKNPDGKGKFGFQFVRTFLLRKKLMP
jgi:hypothetical protein